MLFGATESIRTRFTCEDCGGLSVSRRCHACADIRRAGVFRQNDQLRTENDRLRAANAKLSEVVRELRRVTVASSGEDPRYPLLDRIDEALEGGEKCSGH